MPMTKLINPPAPTLSRDAILAACLTTGITTGVTGLAAAVGVSRVHLSRALSGASPISPALMERLEETLGKAAVKRARIRK